MTFELSKEFRFEAAHKLDHHDGKCARLHGHSWVGRVFVKGDCLETEGPKRGMLIDYSDIKKEVNKLVDEYLDHHYLNETLELYMSDPTSENVAKFVYDKLSEKLPVSKVEIEETCTSKCVYYEHL